MFEDCETTKITNRGIASKLHQVFSNMTLCFVIWWLIFINRFLICVNNCTCWQSWSVDLSRTMTSVCCSVTWPAVSQIRTPTLSTTTRWTIRLKSRKPQSRQHQATISTLWHVTNVTKPDLCEHTHLLLKELGPVTLTTSQMSMMVKFRATILSSQREPCQPDLALQLESTMWSSKSVPDKICRVRHYNHR